MQRFIDPCVEICKAHNKKGDKESEVIHLSDEINTIYDLEMFFDFIFLNTYYFHYHNLSLGQLVLGDRQINRNRACVSWRESAREACCDEFLQWVDRRYRRMHGVICLI